MNILDVQDKLKNLSEQQLVQEMQMPSGSAPQFLVLSEITRRKRMRDDLMSSQQMPQQTVAEEAIAMAGMPQEGLGQMAQAMAPQSDTVQNTGISQLMPQAAPVQGMAEGGPVRGSTIVRNGRRYIQMPDGNLVDEMTGMPLIGYGAGYGTMGAISGMGSPEEMYRRSLIEGATARPNVPPVDLDLTSVNPSFEEFRPDRFAAPGTVPPMGPGRESIIPPPPRGLPTGGMPASMSLADRVRNSNLPQAAFLGTMRPPYDAEPATFDPLLAFAEDFAAPGAGRTPSPASAPMQEPSVLDVARNLEEYYPGSGYLDVMQGGPRVPPPRAPMPPAALPPAEQPAFEDPDAGLINEMLRLQSAEEARAATEAAAAGATEPPAETETLPDAPAAPVATLPSGPGEAGGGTGGGGAGGGAGAAASGMSSYEQELVDAIQRSEKRAEQDKWLALAQAGLALMSSKQPTLGGAIGEAGAQGLAAFRQGRDASEAERMKLIEAQFGAQMARQQMAMRGRGGGGGGGGGGGANLNSLLKMSDVFGEQMSGMLDMAGMPIPAMQDDYERLAAMKAQVDNGIAAMIGLSGASGGAGLAAPVDSVTPLARG
jgi:hypothetical protein